MRGMAISFAVFALSVGCEAGASDGFGPGAMTGGQPDDDDDDAAGAFFSDCSSTPDCGGLRCVGVNALAIHYGYPVGMPETPAPVDTDGFDDEPPDGGFDANAGICLEPCATQFECPRDGWNCELSVGACLPEQLF